METKLVPLVSTRPLSPARVEVPFTWTHTAKAKLSCAIGRQGAGWGGVRTTPGPRLPCRPPPTARQPRPPVARRSYRRLGRRGVALPPVTSTLRSWQTRDQRPSSLGLALSGGFVSQSRVHRPCLIVCASIQVVGFISPVWRSLPASGATAGFVGQSREALFQKPPRPLVDK